MKKYPIRKIIRIVWFSFAAIFILWNWYTFQARSLPENTFITNEKVKVVETKDQIVFDALNSSKTLDIIFFPGGLTDPNAYGPLCRQLALAGCTCHLIKMSLRLAQRDYKKISTMFDLASGHYVIGGHSQGGKMAAQFVYENPGLMKGLFLLGTSHPRDIDLSNKNIPTMKLYAEHDGLASVAEVLENKPKLPMDTQLLFIKGGNHWYWAFNLW